MKGSKKNARLRRSLRTRAHIRRLGAHRLTVHRSPRHIYAQIIEHADPLVKDSCDRVLVSASTLEKSVTKALQKTGNITAAKHIGQLIAERAIALGITSVAFDRSGYKYHGRVAALAHAARDAGLII